MPKPDTDKKQPEPGENESRLVVDSRELFAGRTEIWIKHDGEFYRLRITRRRRLILQK